MPKSQHVGSVQFANFATCFDIFSGFHGDKVSCKGHDESSAGFLELTIFHKADIYSNWSISP